MEFNSGAKLLFEHHRSKDAALEAPADEAEGGDVHQGKTVVDYGEDGLAVYSDGTKQVPRRIPTPPPEPSRPPPDPLSTLSPLHPQPSPPSAHPTPTPPHPTPP